MECLNKRSWIVLIIVNYRQAWCTSIIKLLQKLEEEEIETKRVFELYFEELISDLEIP